MDSLLETMFQPVDSFRFAVIVEGIYVGTFTECTLPAVTVEAEKNFREGGFNGVHNLPTHITTSNLILKRGVGLSSTLYDWYIDVMEGRWVRAQRAVLIVMLSGPFRTPVAMWSLTKALPVKWSGPELKVAGGTTAVAIETIELVFESFESAMQSSGLSSKIKR